MEIRDKEGLVLTGKDIMKHFKGIIGDMITQLLKAAFGTPISLNVALFEPKSTLQRIADYWSFAPTFLNLAALASNPIERLKYVITFAISGLYISTKQLKPFNPLLGETFEGEFEDGSKVYLEHISHYPTVARFLISGELYKIHGYFDFVTKTEGVFNHSLYVYQKGPITVEFPKIGEKIIYNMPLVKLLNASAEQNRASIWVNTMLFDDVKNNLRGIVKFATNDKIIHNFEGYIIENFFDVKINGKNTKYNHNAEVEIVNKAKLDFQNKKMKNKILCVVTGSWLVKLKFDEVAYWDIDKDIPHWIRPLTNVLPSDGRFREDLIWLYRVFKSNSESEKKLYREFAQGWKLSIELVQRTEREIRKKNKHKKI